MAISAVKIANLALSHIGADSTIEAFTEATAEANVCDLWYDFSRTAVLEGYDWNFARKRITLATHSDAAPDGVWGYRYQYPADCIIARSVCNPAGSDADAVPFSVEQSDNGETKTILTDMEDAILLYTWDQELTDTYSTHFVMALSYRLASHIAFSLTGKSSLQDSMLNKYVSFMLLADASNANERVGSPPREAESIRARA